MLNCVREIEPIELIDVRNRFERSNLLSYFVKGYDDLIHFQKPEILAFGLG